MFLGDLRTLLCMHNDFVYLCVYAAYNVNYIFLFAEHANGRRRRGGGGATLTTSDQTKKTFILN